MCRGIIVFCFVIISKYSVAQNNNSFFEKGKAAFEVGNYETALENFDKCNQTTSWIENLNYYAGVASYNLKHYTKAIVYFTNEIKHNKNNQKAYIFRAMAKGRAGLYKDALRDFKKAERINNENILVYYERGNLKYDFKKYKKAIREYNKTLVIREGFEDAYYKIGLCNYYLNKLPKACENWAKLSDIDEFEKFELIEEVCKKNN